MEQIYYKYDISKKIIAKNTLIFISLRLKLVFI